MEKNEKELEEWLIGTKARVYFYLAKRNPRSVSLEKIANSLKIKKSTVSYHLRELIRRGLVEESGHGRYRLKKLLPFSFLEDYTLLRRAPELLTNILFSLTILLADAILGFPLKGVGLLAGLVSFLIFTRKLFRMYRVILKLEAR